MARGLQDFNPHHAPGGSSKGGQFTFSGGASGSKTPAQDLLETHRQLTESFEDVAAQLTPKQKAMVEKAEIEMRQLTPTNVLYKGPDGKYTKEREELHDRILDEMFDYAAIRHAFPKVGEKPVLTLTGGRPASGKTSSLKDELTDTLKNSFYLSADTIQEHLPGYRGDHAGLFNGEGQDIALRAEKDAIALGLNIIYDATMKSQAPANERVDAYKAKGYDVDGYFVYTSPKVSALRSIERFERSGRYVPLEVSFSSRTNEKTFDSLIPKFRKWALYDNNGEKPIKIASGGSMKTKDAIVVNLHDTFIMDGVHRKEDGYLAAFAKVARTGIQEYKGKELGRPDLTTVRVYRSPEEVFSKDALISMAHRPITMTHPRENVNAKNWKKVAVGHTGDEILRDGEYVKIPMLVMDAAAVESIDNGRAKELSWGYSTELVWGNGVTEDGQEYDAAQTKIRANHLAIVPVARGGSNLRIGDEGVKTMQIIVDSVPIEIADDVAGAVLKRHLAKMDAVNDAFELFKKKKDDEEEEKKKTKDALQKTCDAKDGEIAVLKKQVEDAKLAMAPDRIDALVKVRAGVIDQASRMLDKTFVFDGKTVEDIKRAAVTVGLGDAAKTMNDDAIQGAFLALANLKTSDGTQRLADAVRLSNQSPNLNDAQKLKDAAWEESGKVLENAWKTPSLRQ